MIPYSMPLWTILVKCPAPLGPRWSHPPPRGVGTFAARRPLDVPPPGATDFQMGSSRLTALSSPPIIRQ